MLSKTASSIGVVVPLYNGLIVNEYVPGAMLSVSILMNLKLVKDMELEVGVEI